MSRTEAPLPPREDVDRTIDKILGCAEEPSKMSWRATIGVFMIVTGFVILFAWFSANGHDGRKGVWVSAGIVTAGGLLVAWPWIWRAACVIGRLFDRVFLGNAFHEISSG